MKKLAIIGAGIAGLTCGIYARINGFDVDIYELYTIPGGECTGWDRKGYHFDGCLHWLVGTKSGMSFNPIWMDTGVLDDSVDILHHDIFSRYEEGDAFVNFYTDADRLERHFNEIAPEDGKATAGVCRAIRKLDSFSIPMEKPMDMMKASDGIRFVLGNISRMGIIGRYSKLTVGELAAEFKNPLLRRAITAAFPADTASIAFIMTLGSMNAGDSGYPSGGSRALARRMEARFAALGGTVHYKSKAGKIMVEDGSAVGIRLEDGREIRTDAVISCGDGYDTLTRLLGGAYTPEAYRNLFANPGKYPTYTSAMVFAGVDTDIPYDYRSVMICRETPVNLGGVENGYVSLFHYGFDPTASRPGKTVLACYYNGNYDFWNEAAQSPERYETEKKKLEADAIAAIIMRYPEAEGKIEVTDVVTPKTYERYCNAWRGSWMAWQQGPDVPRYFSGVLPGLKNFIMAGMWTLPPGGLPGAGAAGRYAAQRLCIQNGIEFRTK